MQNQPSSTKDFSLGRKPASPTASTRQWDKLVEKLEHWIADHPLPAAMAAASVGLVAGWWIKRK